MVVGGDSEGVGGGGSPSGVRGIFGLETNASSVVWTLLCLWVHTEQQ